VPKPFLRLLLTLAVLPVAVALPADGNATARKPATARQVSIFYYPWYGTAAADGSYAHWAQRAHLPPDDIAANFYPARGLYSSSDAKVLDAQMDEIARAGVGEVAVSWWGPGSAEGERFPLVAAAARAHGLAVAVHLEPYPGRSAESTRVDIAALSALGIRTFYLYQPQDLPAGDWATMNAQLANVVVYAQTGLAGFARRGGFAGVYTYDLVTYGASSFARICAAAHASGLFCAPSVGPGYDARRGSGDARVKQRRSGATYDAMWRGAIAARADRVTITSYNEWHEGTQIEPAASVARRGAYRYATYEGAYRLRGTAAETAYLERTAYWTKSFADSSLARLLYGGDAR